MSKGTFKEFDLFSIFSPIWWGEGVKNGFSLIMAYTSMQYLRMCWFYSRKAKNGCVCQNVPFCPILCPFLVKIDPKSVIFTKTWCFFTGRYHMGFKTKNWFIGDIGKHIQSFVSEFASLVHKMGLEPLNLRFFGLVQKAFETQNACHMWLLWFNPCKPKG